MNKIKLFLILTLICIVLTACSSVDEITYPYPDSKDVVVTFENFNKLENGMSYDEVWDIIGGECTITGETGEKDSEYYTISYGCNGKGSSGANAILMFQDGKLYSKAQTGLK